MAYCVEFKNQDRDFYSASRAATIVSFEPYQKTDIHSSEANNSIVVRFDHDKHNKVVVNARHVWPRKPDGSTSQRGGGVGGSAGGAAAAEKMGLAELQLQYKQGQAHIVELATENKQLGESAAYLMQRNIESEQELKFEKSCKLKVIERCIILETASSNAQEQQQIAQDKLLDVNKQLQYVQSELREAKQELQDVQEEFHALRDKKQKRKLRRDQEKTTGI